MSRFEEAWKQIEDQLREPILVREGEWAFHAWYDAGADPADAAVWIKPLKGKKQVRLPHRQEALRKVFDTHQESGSDDPLAYKGVTLRGHLLYLLLKRLALLPT